MRRRDFIAALGGATVWPFAARAQQAPAATIGLLTALNLAEWATKAIQKGLDETGYLEGRNLTIISRSAEGQFDRLPALAADLVKSQVAVILATGSPVPARTAKAATITIPIVFAYGGDPVADGAQFASKLRDGPGLLDELRGAARSGDGSHFALPVALHE